MRRNDVIGAFARHVSRGRVDVYKKYDMTFVPQKRAGCRITDMNGRSFINCHCNGGVFNLGHRNRRIIAAATAAMRLYDIGNHHLISAPRAMLGRALAESMPDKLNQVVYGVGGGEAVDLAIKLARGVTGRGEIISARGGYHGHTGFALAAGDRKFKEKFKPVPAGFTQMPFNDIESLRKAITRRTAAVIFETIPATLGIVLPHKDFFKHVKSLCEHNGALLILDEVQTGFGRTGRLWGFENFGVVPDIVVLGKGMSGGIYPISATVFHERYASFFRQDPFVHISTFGGSEIGCLVAMEVLGISRKKEFLAHVREMGGLFRKRLSEMSRRHQRAQFTVRGIGLMMGLEFRDEATSLLMMKLLFDNGVYMVYSGNDPRVLQFLPPLIINAREAGEVLHAVERSLKAFSGNGV